MFKSLAKCIKDSIKIDPNMKGSLTTKGVLW
jgi:imidazoleglycerol phosphate dehydratase HisB